MEGKKGHWARFLAPRTQPLWSVLSCLLLFLVFSLDESREGERATERDEERGGGRWCKGGEVETDRQTRENRGVGTDGQPPLDYWAG